MSKSASEGSEEQGVAMVLGLRLVILTLPAMIALFNPLASAQAQQPTKLKVGVLPSVNSAPFFLGLKKGFFREEELEVEPQVMQGGSELTIALISGATQISHIGGVNAVIARGRGLPIKVITFYLKERSSFDQSFMRIVVRPDSNIKTAKDLEGKVVATNEIRGYGEVVVKASLEKQGVNLSSVKITEIPFPDMLSALTTKRVDAIWAIEPFLTMALDAGNIAVDAPAATLAGSKGKDFVDGAWMATETYIAANPKVVDQFVRAMNRSTQYASEHIDEVRAIIPTYTRVKQELANRINLPKFDATIDREMMQANIDYTQKYGIIENSIALDQLLR
jgi:NitT/TauT family transport system substrate-binding protein